MNLVSQERFSDRYYLVQI